jgi:hypothetical protein
MRFAGGTLSYAALRGGAMALLLVLGACAADRQIAEAQFNGRQAMEAGHPSEAARQYSAALARARAIDNGDAIATAGTNLAIAELADNKPNEALADARALQAELAKRGRKGPPTLDLVIATSLYRLGHLREAEEAATPVAAIPNQAVALRARFLLGLIAAEQHDTAGVLAASLVLAGSGDAYSVADATELKARLDLARGEHRPAQSLAMQAVKLRTELRDDRGVARCEALAADAALAGNARAEAAGLYLRAGQQAAAIGDTPKARQWLAKAKSLTRDPHVASVATQALASLGS